MHPRHADLLAAIERAGDRTRPAAEILAVVESLFAGESHEEKTLAALLLGYHRAAPLSVAATKKPGFPAGAVALC